MTEPEHLERDGFQVTNKTFTHPSNGTSDQTAKRQMTLCNLFANHQLPIPDIVRLLDETYDNVIAVLIQQGYVLERRKHPRQPVLELVPSRPKSRMIY